MSKYYAPFSSTCLLNYSCIFFLSFAQKHYRFQTFQRNAEKQVSRLSARVRVRIGYGMESERERCDIQSQKFSNQIQRGPYFNLFRRDFETCAPLSVINLLNIFRAQPTITFKLISCTSHFQGNSLLTLILQEYRTLDKFSISEQHIFFYLRATGKVRNSFKIISSLIPVTSSFIPNTSSSFCFQLKTTSVQLAETVGRIEARDNHRSSLVFLYLLMQNKLDI